MAPLVADRVARRQRQGILAGSRAGTGIAENVPLGHRPIIASNCSAGCSGRRASETKMAPRQSPPEKHSPPEKMMFQFTLRRRGVSDQAVLRAMEEVPREAFVEEADRGDAYRDCALGIGCGQTISQPFVVAYMTE